MAISELEAKSRGVAIAASYSDGASADQGLKSLVRNLKDKAELRAIEDALAATNWNRKLAAARLSISYKALLTKSNNTGLFSIKCSASIDVT